MRVQIIPIGKREFHGHVPFMNSSFKILCDTLPCAYELASPLGPENTGLYE